MRHYAFSDKSEGYLLYVGRIAPKKGLYHAINVAKRLNLQLIIAAKFVETHKDYFDEFIKPHLSEQIKWIGEVNDLERNMLMSHASAVLHPALWDEPFGLVMIEAMACGAPVIAYNRGSIPEIVKDGKTGFVVENEQEMLQAVTEIGKINRSYCRKYALSKFNVEKMTDEYEMVYEAIIKGAYKKLKKSKHIQSPHPHLPKIIE